ncbi:ATP-dependent zinc metalloprotease YME1L [Polistes fuscatus]|uniref:ATP-dependent zinc metalloprotease YME1L n=1 Tax=Polistes fuscatus TaxID=30207 RepID=UPI001CA7E88E|nr:ATP-dependent zinc metalloprotease YME1L [Polistes fuscatus]
MITLQSHNQVLFHLTQLTSSINPRFVPFVVKEEKKSKLIHRNEDLCLDSFVEVAKNCKNLPILKLNVNNIANICGTKNDNLWLILDNIFLKTSKKSLRIDSKWNVSYTSGTNFTENKRKFPCSELTQSMILPAIYLSFKKQYKPFHNVWNIIPSNCNVQVRSFKTERDIKVTYKRNPSVFTRMKEWFDSFGLASDSHKTSFPSDLKPQDIEFMNRIFANMNDITGETKKSKVAFAEGYALGLQAKVKNRKGWLKFINWLTIALLVLIICFPFINLGSVFRFSFSNKSEIDPEEIHFTFDDIKGVEEAKQELKDIVEFLRDPDRFTSLGAKLPKGVLLVGQPGTGKTILARAVAGEAGVPFFHAAGPEFDEILVGQGARRVRDLFKTAKEKAPCVIFIDEIDSIGATRTPSVLHPYANQTINQLLSEMDGFHRNEGVIVLGATNRRDDLDKALLRPGRFDVEVNVRIPDYTGRKEILELYLAKIMTRDIDVDYLARGTTGFTGADIENMVNQAALQAAILNSDYVTMKHLEYARDKVLMGPEGKSKIPDEETNRITAYHEAGHALVGLYTKEADPLHKVTIIPRGPSLGHTSYIPEKDNYLTTKSHLLARMDCLMGGRAAEELIFGPDKITTGAASDFQNATKIAETMVQTYGMSDKVGVRMYDFQKNSNYAPSTNEMLDNEVKRLLQDSYERAKNILKLHAKEHKQLADALIEYEILDSDEIKAIINGKKIRTETPNKKATIIDVPNKNVPNPTNKGLLDVPNKM